ncbi:hypothetical protein GOM44_03240 [Wolbachia endosymbiont of Atemnus politus]|nr:hypothetical protein [Wolbachia endosymbiont of Atemnus politus]
MWCHGWVGVGYGVAGIGLPILAIISITVAAALTVALVTYGITCAVLKPSDKLDEPNLQASNQRQV